MKPPISEPEISAHDALVVEPAPPQAAAELGALTHRAFHDLDASRYLVPDPDLRRQLMPKAFGWDIEDVLQDGGRVSTTRDRLAVAVWTFHDAGAQPPIALDPRIARLDAAAAERYQRFYTALHGWHPHDTAYARLLILATDPAHQSRGRGSAQLDAGHKLVDERGLPCVLEAASEQAAALYRRHGYEQAADLIVLPDGAQLIPMRREPRPINPVR